MPEIPLIPLFTPEFHFTWRPKSAAPSAMTGNFIKLEIPRQMYRRRVYVAISYIASADAATGFAVDANVEFVRDGKIICSFPYKRQEVLTGEFFSLYPNTGSTENAFKWRSRDGTVDINILPIAVNVEADYAMLRIDNIKTTIATMGAVLGIHSEFPA